VPVVVAKNRYLGGRSVEDRHEKVIHLLDDGYQHLQLKRSLNILVLDATDPFGGEKLLPAGRLREPIKALCRADAIVISRSHIGTGIDELENRIRNWNKTAPISYFHHDAIALFDARKAEKRFLVRHFLDKRVIALAAVGNPGVFLHDLAHYQMKVVDRFFFRDHHRLTQAELEQVLICARQRQADAVITTEKDAVRLHKLQFEEGQIFVLKIEFKPLDAENYQKQFLEEVRSLQEAK
jgi:tetraacyldisaccharide 4'-kinase